MSLNTCIASLLLEHVTNPAGGRRCDGCNKDRVAYTEHRAFTRLPLALALHLRRGVYVRIAGVDVAAKNFRHVDLPEMLDMTPHTSLQPLAAAELSTRGGRLMYRLVSVVVHLGEVVTSGHYIAYRRARLEDHQQQPPAQLEAPVPVAAGPGSWECWDDERIEPATWNAVSKQPAYLVFYECVDPALHAAVFALQ